MAIISLDDYMAQQKKKKKNVISLEEYMESQGLSPIGKDDIAPVKTTSKKEEKKEQKNSYLQKGALEDGFSLKNLWKGTRATKKDMQEDVVKGGLSGAEKVTDFFYMLSSAMAQSNARKTINDQILFDAVVKGEDNADVHYKTLDDTTKALKQDAMDFVAKDLIKEEEIAHNLYIAPFEERTGINVEEKSFLGAKSDALVQSASEMLIKQGVNYIAPGMGTVLTIASAGGGQMQEAIDNGATFEEAVLSGIWSGGAEAISEEIFGGIKFGGKSLTDEVIKGIAKNIPNKFFQTLAKWGFDTAGEGIEEVFSYYLTSIGQNLTYLNEKEFNEIFTSEEAWENFVAGSIMGGLFGGASAINSEVNPNTKTDYVTGKDKNEQKVFDNLYEDAIKNKEVEKGSKLTAKEKRAIYDGIEESLTKGYVDTDRIESVLGGQTYETYKQALDNETALKTERDKLSSYKKRTNAQEQRLAEINELLGKSNTGDLKAQLSNEVLGKAKGTGLEESYNEKARRGQAFQTDLSKYDEKQRVVVQKAVESGILNNTNRTHDFVDLIAKLGADKGISFDFTNNERLKQSGFAMEGKTVNGFVQGGNITLNINSAKALNSVVGHEVTHVLEGTEFYSELQNAIFEYAKTKGEYDTRLADITELYKNVKDADINGELTADLIGDYLFTDEKFVRQLFQQNRNVFQKVWNEIKYLCKTATAESQEAKKLLEVQKTFEKVWDEGTVAKKDTDVKYHVSSSFEQEIDKVLNNQLKSSEQVKARDYTPKYLVENGAKNLPMLITQKHIKTVIYTEAEAKKLGLPVAKGINYHGLGKELLVQSIDNMDSPVEVYKKSADEFIIITSLTDSNGDTIIVPVQINGKGVYNDVYIDENHITSVYGKRNLQNYLQNNNFTKLDIKKGTALNEGVQYSNISNSFDNSISQNSENATENTKKSLSNNSQDIAPIGKWHVKGSDIAPVRKDIGMSTSNLPDDYAPIAEGYLNKPTKMEYFLTENLAKQEEYDKIWLSEYDKLINKDDVTARDDISSLLNEDDSSVIDNVITDGSHLVNGKLKPNVTYKTGEHGYLYKTNENGLIVKASAVYLRLKIHEGRLKHNRNTYGKKAGDHAGHLFGDRFGGSPELDNLVSQAQRVNLKEYKVIENEWVKALKNGKNVSVDINVNYDVGGTRPTSFHISYNIDGVRHFKKIFN